MDEDTAIADLRGALNKLRQAQELVGDHELDTANETIACHHAIEYAQSLLAEALEARGVSWRERATLQRV